jgi:hypothetical protein
MSDETFAHLGSLIDRADEDFHYQYDNDYMISDEARAEIVAEYDRLTARVREAYRIAETF